MDRRIRVLDWLVPGAIALLGLVELATLAGVGSRGAGVVVLLVSCALLVARRTHPVVAVVAATITAAGPFVGPAYDEAATPLLVIVLSTYALGRWVSDLRGALGLVVPVLVITSAYVFVDTRDVGLDDAIFVASFVVPPFVLGRVVRRLADYNDLLRREQELRRREGMRDERDRIARDLHDVIAHSLSAMVVQVAAAQDLLTRDPAQAAAMLERVAGAGRTAIAETGRLLHVMRDTDDELGLRPSPGLRDLDELVGEFERAGLAVDLDVTGVVEDVPGQVDVSAYRIVREALTNALRYAPDHRVRLHLTTDGETLTLGSRNRSDGVTGLGSGLGLRGLEERVDLLGGTLRAGSTTDGCYELVVTLPVALDRV